MNCPKCKEPLIKTGDLYICNHCGAKFRPKKTETPPQPKVEEEEISIEELKRDLKKLEEKIEKYAKNHPFDPSSTSVSQGKTTSFFKSPNGQKVKKGVGVLLVLGILVTIIVVCVYTLGLYGTYVKVDNPDEYISFNFGKYVMKEEGSFGTAIISNGTYKESSGTVIMQEKLTDEEKELAEGFLGVTEEDLKQTVTFEKVDGYKIIELDGEKYIRVSKKKVKKILGEQVTITFADKDNGKIYGTVTGEVGESFTFNMDSYPTMDNYVFKGWNTNPDDPENGFSLIYSGTAWCDTTYYAVWEQHTHTINSYCVCTGCGKTIHNLNEKCVCQNCGQTKHQRNSDGYCTLCKEFDLAIVASKMGSSNYYKSGTTIFFGSYPQSEVVDSSLKNTLRSKAGNLPTSSNQYAWKSYSYYVNGDNSNQYMWYIDIEYSGEKYRGVYFTNYRPWLTTYVSYSTNSYQDDNGYQTNQVYWFKFEPIQWEILEEKNGYATILSKQVLDCQQFSTSNNKYDSSDIRTWLNDSFYCTAFDEIQQQLIEIVSVDNSERSTNIDINEKNWNNGKNENSCNGTNDKVWILSIQNATKTTNNFNTDPDAWDDNRLKMSTKYAQVQGIFTNSNEGYKGASAWWLSSPYYGNTNEVWYVCSNGQINKGSMYDIGNGIAPALKIRLY